MQYKFHFKVVKDKNTDMDRCLTVGKIYEAIDGKFTDDGGFVFDTWDNPDNAKGDSPFERLCDWWKHWYDFKLVEEHATNEKIVITVEGNTTLARLYKDGKVVKSAEARCCPEDKFDFKVGANLAYNRLMGVPTGEEKVEKKEAPKPVTKFKAGDKVVVRKNTCSHFYEVGDVLILKHIWNSGLGIEKRVMWIFTTGDTIDDPNGSGYIVEDDIELYDTLKLTKEDIKKMKDGKKVWCSVINHPVFGKEEEQFDDADYCMWYTIRHLSPTSTVLVGEDGDYWDIDDIGIEFNAYLTEQKVK